jgi:hypothetical protein
VDHKNVHLDAPPTCAYLNEKKREKGPHFHGTKVATINQAAFPPALGS